MRTPLLIAALTALVPCLAAQDPTPPKPPKPGVEKPVVVKPVVEKPVEQDPVIQKPGAEKPGVQKPGSQDPAEKPGEAKPGKQDPQVDPHTGRPVSTGDQSGDKTKPTETSISGIEEKSADELPKGMDPADIAAMQSAQAMLKAEAKLKKLLAEGKIKDIDRILTFEEIESWPYEDGLTGMPKALKKMDGEKVMMTGFMLPIDEVEDIKEFLLVQSLWSCCYGQPPDINGIVRVVMKGKSRIDYQFDPIKIVGTFKVEAAYEDGYCLDIYQLHADSVEAIR